MTGAVPSWHNASDAELAGAAARGDRQALAGIYDRYADRLYDFSLGLVGDREAAADCVQDVFCIAATSLSALREPDKLRPWLYSIARHQSMSRLRHRYREQVSDDLPDGASHEPGPDTMAGHSELAMLVTSAAGGLSDRDRELLELTYRHGLDGPELADALGVTLTNANTMVFRLRKTIERSLGALLVARNVRANRDACPELAAALHGWDGHFTVLTRKRVVRHIESCHTCTQEQRRRVNPTALLGGAPLFIPAPEWLRDQTFRRVQLTSASSGIHHTAERAMDATPSPSNKRVLPLVALVAGIPLSVLGITIAWLRPVDTAVTAATGETELPTVRTIPSAVTAVRTTPPGSTPTVTSVPTPVATTRTTGTPSSPTFTTTAWSTPALTTTNAWSTTPTVTTPTTTTPTTTTPTTGPDTTTPTTTTPTTTPPTTPPVSILVTTTPVGTPPAYPGPEPLPTPIPTPTSVVPDGPVIH